MLKGKRSSLLAHSNRTKPGITATSHFVIQTLFIPLTFLAGEIAKVNIIFHSPDQLSVSEFDLNLAEHAQNGTGVSNSF